MTERTVRSSFSVHVAAYIEKGYSCAEALQVVLGGIRDGSGPRTTDVLLDLEDMGVWKPGQDDADEASTARM
jgi:hypothetical protein